MTDIPRVTAQRPPEPVRAAPDAGLTARPGVLGILRAVVALFAYASLAVWGFVSFELPWNVIAGIGAPLLAIALWALFVTPRSIVPVHPFIAAVVELLIWVSVTIAWWMMGFTWVGIGFAVIAVAVGVLAGRRRFT